MTRFSDSVSARLLRELAKAVCRHPRWFVYPQILLALAGALIAAGWLKLDMNRDHLIGTNVRQQRLFLQYRKEFPSEDEIDSRGYRQLLTLDEVEAAQVNEFELDEETTTATLGKPHATSKIQLSTLMRTTEKILARARDEVEDDTGKLALDVHELVSDRL